MNDIYPDLELNAANCEQRMNNYFNYEKMLIKHEKVSS